MRTPAQIEADIISRRAQLAEVLDEIGVRVHPKTVIGDARAKVASVMDRTAGQAFVAVNRSVSDVKAQFVSEDGSPRLGRVIPVALVVVGAAALLTVSVRGRKR